MPGRPRRFRFSFLRWFLFTCAEWFVLLTFATFLGSTFVDWMFAALATPWAYIAIATFIICLIYVSVVRATDPPYYKNFDDRR